MKKFLSVLLAVLLCTVLSLTPVLAEETAAETTAEETVEAAEETVEETAEAAEATEEAVEETVEAAEETAEATEEAAEEVVEEAAEEESKESWVSYAFGKLGEIQWYIWVVLAILVVFGIVMCTQSTKWTSRRLAYAAMCIAISFILALIRLYRMPQGGSITLLSKLPLVMFTMAFGPAYGLVAGCAAGLLALLHDPYVIHPIQLLVDYPFASGAVALAALANVLPVKSDKVKLAVGTVLGYFGSYMMAVLSGAIFFGEYAWEGYSAWGYSFAYNISYTGPECVIAVVIVLLVPGLAKLVKELGKK